MATYEQLLQVEHSLKVIPWWYLGWLLEETSYSPRLVEVVIVVEGEGEGVVVMIFCTSCNYYNEFDQTTLIRPR